jgi:hypothetical protein
MDISSCHARQLGDGDKRAVENGADQGEDEANKMLTHV